MRIRFWLYLTFFVFSIFPLMLMGYWAHTSLVQNELSRAGHAQLALAETHADSIDRYLKKQITAFETHADEIFQTGFQSADFITKAGDDIANMFVVDKTTEEVIFHHDLKGLAEPSSLQDFRLSSEQLTVFKRLASSASTSVSPLIRHSSGVNCFYLVKTVGNNIVVGELGTGFLTALADGTRIGSSGHAAIFDSNGALIAHPNKSWQSLGKNIAKLDPVKLAVGGDNGIVSFHSPALNAEMLAGVASIDRAGWGIMIPRTLEDVVGDSGFARRSAAVVFTLVMAAILLGSILVSDFISKPMERLSRQVKKFGELGEFSESEVKPGKAMPTENLELVQSFSEMVENLRITHNKMKEQAYSDSVTNLPNREAFSAIVEQNLAFMANKHMNGAMLFIDLEKFKDINDSHGHGVGDQVLRCLGARFGDVLELATGEKPSKIIASELDEVEHPRACVARFGGDEFVAFVPENNGLSQLERICEQLIEAIESPVPGLTAGVKLSGHIGIASFPEHGLTCRDLVKKADIAVFHAKNNGPRRIQRYGDGTGELTASEMRREIHNAIINDEMELYYQPKVNTMTNDVTSVEALVRWFHPKKGLVSPADFIPAIENSDTTNELGEWVVRRACRDMRFWECQGHRLSIAVNIAAHQFGSERFVERIHQIVIEEDCDPARFEIEVTEETALSGNTSANSVIQQLHTLGFKVSLDDYGRGYSNLTRLSELKVNTIKIDGPLTARLTRDERTRVIFEATINMARGLDCETVAEGVETAEEVAILTKLGCTELQGFYFATPMPQDGIVNWINQRSAQPVLELQEKVRAAI